MFQTSLIFFLILLNLTQDTHALKLKGGSVKKGLQTSVLILLSNSLTKKKLEYLYFKFYSKVSDLKSVKMILNARVVRANVGAVFVAEIGIINSDPSW